MTIAQKSINNFLNQRRSSMERFQRWMRESRSPLRQEVHATLIARQITQDLYILCPSRDLCRHWSSHQPGHLQSLWGCMEPLQMPDFWDMLEKEGY